MTVLLGITVISAAAVTFLVCFFTALCNETTGRTGRVERISPAPIKWNGGNSTLRMRPIIMNTQAACDRR
jgi:hypothetical protein